MKKAAVFLAMAIGALSCSPGGNYVKDRFEATTPEGISTAVAHRGCWLMEPDGEYYIPENSIDAVRMAARYGYPAVEIDVKYTLDLKMVAMHDGTINRTMRNAADYSKIEKPVRVDAMMFEDLRKNYVLESSDPDMRRPIPTLEEILKACKQTGVVPMLHSKILESYELAQKILGNRWIAFEENIYALKYARGLSDCLVLWDPGKTEAEKTVEGLREIGGWTGMSTMNYNMQDSLYIAKIHQGGCITQSSIFPTPWEQRALKGNTDIQLSDFFWFQTNKRDPVYTINESTSLKAGETWQSAVVPVSVFSAITIELEFKGEIELEVNDRAPRVYPLARSTKGIERAGIRLYKVSPGFEIRAVNDTDVNIKASIYEL